MKKLTLIVILAIAAASCSKEETPIPVPHHYCATCEEAKTGLNPTFCSFDVDSCNEWASAIKLEWAKKGRVFKCEVKPIYQ
jgi:hypothetical protein